MRIEKYSFGNIRIDGRDYSQDVILLGNQVKGPWWREAGGHVYACLLYTSDAADDLQPV